MKLRSMIITLAVALWGMAVGAACRAAPAPARVAVVVEVPGRDAVMAEHEVAAPIERALAGVAGVTHVEVRSTDGWVAAEATLARGVEPFAASAAVRERVQAVLPSLPSDVAPPVIIRRGAPGDDEPAWEIVDPRRSQAELGAIADRVVRPAAERVAGVAAVERCGGGERQVTIGVDAERLAAVGLGIAELRAAVASRALDLGGGGLLLRIDQRLGVDALGEQVIGTRGGAPVRVRDVAVVTDGAAPGPFQAFRDGRPAVVLRASMQPQPAGDRARALEALAARMTSVPELPPGVRVEPVGGAVGAGGSAGGARGGGGIGGVGGIGGGVGGRSDGAWVALRIMVASELAPAALATAVRALDGVAASRLEVGAADVTSRPGEARLWIAPAADEPDEARAQALRARVAALTGVHGAIVERIGARRAPNLRVLVAIAGADADLARARGVVDAVRAAAPDGLLEMDEKRGALTLRPDRERMAARGITMAMLSDAARAGLGPGLRVGTTGGGGDRRDIVIRLGGDPSLPSPGTLLVRVPVRAGVPLGEVARIALEARPLALLRRDGQRMIELIAGAHDGATAKAVRARLRELSPPAGVTVTVEEMP